MDIRDTYFHTADFWILSSSNYRMKLNVKNMNAGQNETQL
jgi:hypothetical protein